MFLCSRRKNNASVLLNMPMVLIANGTRKQKCHHISFDPENIEIVNITDTKPQKIEKR